MSRKNIVFVVMALMLVNVVIAGIPSYAMGIVNSYRAADTEPGAVIDPATGKTVGDVVDEAIPPKPPRSVGAAAAADFNIPDQQRIAEIASAIASNKPLILGATQVDADLADAVLKLGWLDLTSLTQFPGDQGYSMEVAQDKINIVGYSGDYVAADIDRFIGNVDSLADNQVAVILANSAEQLAALEGDPKIASKLGGKVFVTVLTGVAAMEWRSLQAFAGDTGFYDFRQMSVTRLIENRNVIKSLLAAK